MVGFNSNVSASYLLGLLLLVHVSCFIHTFIYLFMKSFLSNITDYTIGIKK
jgi:hypothetical protein